MGVVLAALVPPALDLLRAVLPGVPLRTVGVIAAALAALLLLTMWARSPRTAWLAAAALAAGASLALRLVGAEMAAGLSLLAVLALGVGGAFWSPSSELESLFEVSPASPDDSVVEAPPAMSQRHEPPRAA